MDAFTLAAKLTLDSKDFERDLGKQEGVFKKFGDGLGNAMKTAGKVVAAGVAAAATGVVALTKAAVESYANYEQLVGGVETLFGTGGKNLEDYAKSVGKSVKDAKGKFNDLKRAENSAIAASKNAYKTAGLSMNQYMETVTSFAASLVAGLSGDTVKAVNYADMAITDMSDNANKMGTSMEAIQNAYQGFAKQNYTMLDNLKLGYGGTKTEMERLIADANKVKEAHGEMADLSIERFSDVVEAIHLIQNEMGITGTTAQEAEHTISGSIMAMKASWANLLVAIASGNMDIGTYVNQLVNTATTAFDNIMPVVENALTGIASFVEKIAPIVAEKLPGMVKDVLPKLLNAAGSILEGVIKALPALFTTLFEAVKNIDWAGLGEAIVGLIKEGLTALDGLFVGLLGENWENFKKAFEDLIPIIAGVAAGFVAIKAAMAITDIITKVQTGFSNMFAVLAAHPFMAVITALVGLGVALVTAYNTNEDFRNKVDAAWNAIKTAAQTVWTTVSSAVELAFEVISKAWEDVSGFFTTTIPEVWNTLSSTANEVWTAIQESITTAIDTAKSTLETTWSAIESAAETVWNALKTVAETVWDGIKTFITNPIGTAETALSSAWSAIESAAKTAWEALKSAAETAWQAIQGFIENPISAAKETLGGIWTSIQSAVTEAWAAIKNTITEVINAITTPINDFIGTVSGAVDGVLKFLGLKPSETPDWNSDVNNKITTPMSGASSAIQGLLGEMASLEAKDGKNLASTTSYHTNYEHTIYTFEGSSGQEHTGTEGKFAKAMFGGKILRGATVFGMNDNGPMIGGEAGPEAIVGVNSLDQMIQKSVSNAVSGILAKMDSLISGQGTGNIEIVLDTGELVGAIGGKMDAELGKIGDWKGGGRA